MTDVPRIRFTRRWTDISPKVTTVGLGTAFLTGVLSVCTEQFEWRVALTGGLLAVAAYLKTDRV